MQGNRFWLALCQADTRAIQPWRSGMPFVIAHLVRSIRKVPGNRGGFPEVMRYAACVRETERLRAAPALPDAAVLPHPPRQGACPDPRMGQANGWYGSHHGYNVRHG